MAFSHLCGASLGGILASNGDPDQTPQSAASDHGLHCLHQIQKFLYNMIHVIIQTNLTFNCWRWHGPKRYDKGESTRINWLM